MVKDGEPKIDNNVEEDLNLPSFTFTFTQQVAAQNLVLAVKKFVNTSGWDEEKVVKLPEYQVWRKAIKGYPVTKLCGSWHDTAIDDRSLSVDLLKMRDDQVYELSQFGADVINKIRNDLGVSDLVGEATANPRMVSTIQEVSRLGMENPDTHPGYDLYALKKAAYDHGMTAEGATAADRRIAATNPYGEMLMILANDHFGPQISVAEAKERIVSALANIALISNGKGKCLGNAEKVIGVLSIPNDKFGDNNEYVGATISFKELEYDSVTRPSYLIHLIQHESWQDVAGAEGGTAHPQVSDQPATGRGVKVAATQSPDDDLPAAQPGQGAVTGKPTGGKGLVKADPPARAPQDPAGKKAELRGHNWVKAAKELLAEVIMAVAYLLGLKKYN